MELMTSARFDSSSLPPVEGILRSRAPAVMALAVAVIIATGLMARWAKSHPPRPKKTRADNAEIKKILRY